MPRKENNESWAVEWLSKVADGKVAMSQRAVSSVEKNGGLDRLVAAARNRGVHLAQFTDDVGKEVIVASRKPFRALC